ncbi:Cell division control protein 7 [Microbotryomycetes sp. JL221]|nr:Cell division control protein 7 [Microbotryomycetes sp. JL221]
MTSESIETRAKVSLDITTRPQPHHERQTDDEDQAALMIVDMDANPTTRLLHDATNIRQPDFDMQSATDIVTKVAEQPQQRRDKQMGAVDSTTTTTTRPLTATTNAVVAGSSTQATMEQKVAMVLDNNNKNHQQAHNNNLDEELDDAQDTSPQLVIQTLATDDPLLDRVFETINGSTPWKKIEKGQITKLKAIEKHNLMSARRRAKELQQDEFGLDSDDEDDDEDENQDNGLGLYADGEQLDTIGRMYRNDEDQDDDQDDLMQDQDSDFEWDDSRSEGEREQAIHEILKLNVSMPLIASRYKLVDRIGEGTFSSVYKAIDLRHHEYENQSWVSPQTITNERGDKIYVAVKRIYVTSSPIRIQNELELLQTLRDNSHIAHLIDAIRHEDQVIAVMPFVRHQDFRYYYRTATMPMIRSYMFSLLEALRATHIEMIIHRDVKPANFLFDTTTGVGVLCDFGLAQSVGGDEFYEWKGQCRHSLPGPMWAWPDGRQRAKQWYSDVVDNTNQDNKPPGLLSGLHGVRMTKPFSLYSQWLQLELDWRAKKDQIKRAKSQGLTAKLEDSVVYHNMKPSMMPPEWIPDLKQRHRDKRPFYQNWQPARQGQSAMEGGKAGYLKEDKRPSVRANRAGTRGFRAPEVLLKCPDQTVALDIWSAGIILLCFLTRRFPFFNSNDDNEALAEITAIFGARKMELCAALHNRTFVTNVPQYSTPPHPTLAALIKSLNPPIFVENSPNPYGPIPSSNEADAEWFQGSELQSCISLLKKCLELDCTRRWTADELLRHEFFTSPASQWDIGNGELSDRPRVIPENFTRRHPQPTEPAKLSRSSNTRYPPSLGLGGGGSGSGSVSASSIITTTLSAPGITRSLSASSSTSAGSATSVSSSNSATGRQVERVTTRSNSIHASSTTTTPRATSSSVRQTSPSNSRTSPVRARATSISSLVPHQTGGTTSSTTAATTTTTNRSTSLSARSSSLSTASATSSLNLIANSAAPSTSANRHHQSNMSLQSHYKHDEELKDEPDEYEYDDKWKTEQDALLMSTSPTSPSRSAVGLPLPATSSNSLGNNNTNNKRSTSTGSSTSKRSVSGSSIVMITTSAASSAATACCPLDIQRVWSFIATCGHKLAFKKRGAATLIVLTMTVVVSLTLVAWTSSNSITTTNVNHSKIPLGLVGTLFFRPKLIDQSLKKAYRASIQDKPLRPNKYSTTIKVLDKDSKRYVKPTKEEIRAYVGAKPKFLVKDNWTTYGYNNVRYMFEATLNMAQIVGRIPVIPDIVWARDCAGETEKCTKHALEYFEHRRQHDEMGPKIWNEEGQAWKLGIEHFVDLPHLRKTYGPVLTLSEYFTLFDLDEQLIEPTGSWNDTTYTPQGLTTTIFSRDEFEFPIDFIRTDRPMKDSNFYPLPDIEGLKMSVVQELRGWQHVWSYDKAMATLTKFGLKLPLKDERKIVAAMDRIAQGPLYTFSDDVLMSKALVLPSIDLVQRSRIRSLSSQLGNEPFVSSDIVYLPGDLHDQRKPGGLRFTTKEARNGFVNMILQSVRAPMKYQELGQTLADRISEKVDGRRWMGAHMRRGDFLGINWSPETTYKGHIARTQKALAKGADEMERREADRLPEPGDIFYLATDETDERALNYFRSQGAILLTDLMTRQDAERLGWESSFTDLLALVEQHVLARSDFFVGSKMSSTTGGIINIRKTLGMPDWSWSFVEGWMTKPDGEALPLYPPGMEPPTDEEQRLKRRWQLE